MYTICIGLAINAHYYAIVRKEGTINSNQPDRNRSSRLFAEAYNGQWLTNSPIALYLP